MEMIAKQDVEPLYACGEVCCRQWISKILSERCGQMNQDHCLISGRPGICLLTKMTAIFHQLTITSAGMTASPRTDLPIKHSLTSVLISDHSFI